MPLRGDVRGTALAAWTLLAALAAQTERLRLGVLVTSNRIRRPAVLAKMAATVDVISGGRLDFGIGAGGSQVPGDPVVEGVHREFDAFGIPVVSAGEAINSLGEACTLFRRMWTEDDLFDFDGHYHQLKGVICEPKPIQRPHPPILIGGGGEKTTLRVVAEQADMWNCPARTGEEYLRKSRILDEHCAAIGRDLQEITRSMQILVRGNDAQAASTARTQLLDLIRAGVTHLVLGPTPPFATAKWLADAIVQPVLDEVGD